MADKYTRSAEEQECQVRIPGACSFDPAKTIFAHLNGGGMAMKHSSIHGAYCCSKCHDVVDGRSPTKFSQDELKLWLLEGVIRTQIIMINSGLLRL